MSGARLAVRPAQRRLRDGRRGHPHVHRRRPRRRDLRRRRRRADRAGAGAGVGGGDRRARDRARLARRPADRAAARASASARERVALLLARYGGSHADAGLDPETAAVADALALVPYLDERAVALVFADLAAALAARLARASPRFGPEPATPFAWSDAGVREPRSRRWSTAATPTSARRSSPACSPPACRCARSRRVSPRAPRGRSAARGRWSCWSARCGSRPTSAPTRRASCCRWRRYGCAAGSEVPHAFAVDLRRARRRAAPAGRGGARVRPRAAAVPAAVRRRAGRHRLAARLRPRARARGGRGVGARADRRGGGVAAARPLAGRRLRRLGGRGDAAIRSAHATPRSRPRSPAARRRRRAGSPSAWLPASAALARARHHRQGRRGASAGDAAAGTVHGAGAAARVRHNLM